MMNNKRVLGRDYEMNKQHEILFEEGKIGSVRIKNKYILCAMEGAGIIEAHQGYQFNENCRNYMITRAKNDVALIIPGCVQARNFVTGQWLYECEELFEGPIKELMNEIHNYGTKLFLQVGAGTGRSTAAVPMFQALYFDEVKKAQAKQYGCDIEKILQAPSAGLPDVWDPAMKTFEMPKSTIEEYIKAYGKIAKLAQRAGIDGIEIHAVHEGYLLDQFTMECSNHRCDEYGGSFENRMRFVCDIIREIKNNCGKDYPVSVRYSVESKMRDFGKAALPGENYKEFGRSLEESVKVAQALEKAGADLLNADNGTYDSWFWAHPPVYMPLACNLDSVAFVKKHVSIPVACAGRMEDPDTGAEAIRQGKIDFIGVARQFLCDAEYLTKIKNGNVEDIRPCIACHNGCFAMYKNKDIACGIPDHPMGRCALNPETFQEKEYEITPAPVKKKITVIGGGIGGMETARVCALRGHEVTIYEKTNQLGGVFIAAAAPVFKEKDRMLLAWYKLQMEKLNIQIEYGCEMLSSELQKLQADEIIIATGAVPRKLPVKGIENENVAEAIEFLLGKKEVGENVAIIGGGLTGCEIAYELVLKGKKPIVIEAQNDILKIKNLSAANSNMLREIIRYYEIPVLLNTTLHEITENAIVVEQDGAQKSIPVDSVILSVGYLPEHKQYLENQNVKLVGDALKVGNLMDVIWGANQIALSI